MRNHRERRYGQALPGSEGLREQILPIVQADEKQLGIKEAREKFVQEASFTTLNRLVGLKVMEARGLLERTYVTKSIDTEERARPIPLPEQEPAGPESRGQGINTVLRDISGVIAGAAPAIQQQPLRLLATPERYRDGDRPDKLHRP